MGLLTLRMCFHTNRTLLWQHGLGMLMILFLSGCTMLPPVPAPPSPDQETAVLHDHEHDNGHRASLPYTVRSEDKLRVTVAEHPAFSRDVAVATDGSLSYPIIGTVSAAGLTVPELERQIAQHLREHLVDPQVTISMLEYRYRHAYVLGAVRAPGRHALGHNTTLVELIGQAGGITSDAGWIAMFAQASQRQNGAVPTTDTELEQHVTMRLDLDEVLAGEVQPTLLIESGDIIYIPEAGHFFVAGEVQRPGKYRLERDMNTLKAITQAGGLTPFGTTRRVKVKRYHMHTSKCVYLCPAGMGRRGIELQEAKEFRLKMSDLLQAGDVVVVPNGFF